MTVEQARAHAEQIIDLNKHVNSSHVAVPHLATQAVTASYLLDLANQVEQLTLALEEAQAKAVPVKAKK